MGKVWTMLITRKCGGRNCWPNSVTSGSHVNQSANSRPIGWQKKAPLIICWFIGNGILNSLSQACLSSHLCAFFCQLLGQCFLWLSSFPAYTYYFLFFFFSFGINNNRATILGKKNWTTSTSEISTLTLSLPCLCTLSMYQNDAWKCVSYGLFSFIFNWNYISDSLECKNFEHYA